MCAVFAIGNVWAQNSPPTAAPVVNDAPPASLQADTTIVQGNTELPKYLYVVPWQEKRKQTQGGQKVTLQNVYGDILVPQNTAHLNLEAFDQHVARAKK